MPNQPFSEATARKIRACIRDNPGMRAREVGSVIGLPRSTVNSYLYSKRSGALGHAVYQDSNYGWHLNSGTANSGERGGQYTHLEVRELRTAVPSNPQPTKLYSSEVIREVFRNDDYAMLSDNEQGKLAEMLAEAELAQRRQKQDLTSVHKPQLLKVLTTGWFWFGVALGGMAIYGGLQLAPQLLQSPPVPVKQQTPSLP